MLLVLLVLFCVSRINMVHSKADSIVISPLERFHKRKLNYSKNLKAGFGEYCQAHDNEGDNTLKPRTTGAFTVYDTGARDVRWYLFNLNSRNLINRKTLPSYRCQMLSLTSLTTSMKLMKPGMRPTSRLVLNASERLAALRRR